MREAFFDYLLICLCALNPIVAFHNSEANAADGRYELREYSKNGCSACTAALVDVDRLIQAGVDVRCFNTSTDPQAAWECRRNYLHLRPAWRLTRTADGAEVGRWYGAGVADVIIATIRTKFPTPEPPKSTPEVIEQEETAPEVIESEIAPEEPAPEREPVESKESEEPKEPKEPDMLAQFDAELGAELCDGEVCQAEPPEDFRDRKPVAEKFEDVGFLDDSLDEWEGRKDAEPTAPEQGEDGDLIAPKFRQEENPEEPNDARLGDRLTDRAAEHILEGVLCKIDEVKKDAFAKFDEIGGRATDQLEGRVQKEFEGAKALIEKRIDDALRDAKAEIRRQIGVVVKDLICGGIKVILFLCGVALVCWIIWKTSGVAKKIAGV